MRKAAAAARAQPARLFLLGARARPVTATPHLCSGWSLTALLAVMSLCLASRAAAGLHYRQLT